MKKLSLLGSTGSIGCNVLDVVRQYPERFSVVSLAAGRNIKLLSQQVAEFSPDCVSVFDKQLANELKKLLPQNSSTEILYGTEGNIEVARHRDAHITISAIVGAAGLLPTLAAIRAGKDIGLANKETLVMAGKLVMGEVASEKVGLLPVDSEHSAIFQALEAGRKEDVHKIILTASGGPFRSKSRSDLHAVTVAEALNHPRWTMGKKISIDSATLMNKGLEVIEARWLFDMAPDKIEVVIHPQSVVHSLVEFNDGSCIAQLGIADMRIPIAYALSYPERLQLDLPALSLTEWSHLDFHAPDFSAFPALQLAYEAIKVGGIAPAVLNAANEVAVDAFLDERIGFLDIAAVVAETLNDVHSGKDDSLDDILYADSEARKSAARHIQQYS